MNAGSSLIAERNQPTEISGAKGYLVKAADSEQIEETLRTVAAVGSLFLRAITLELA